MFSSLVSKLIDSQVLAILRPGGRRVLVLVLDVALLLDLVVSRLNEGRGLLAVRFEDIHHGSRIVYFFLALLLFFYALPLASAALQSCFGVVADLVSRLPFDALWQSIFGPNLNNDAHDREKYRLRRDAEKVLVDEGLLLTYAIKTNSSIASQLHEQHRIERQNSMVARDLNLAFCVLSALDFFLLKPESGGIIRAIWHSFDNVGRDFPGAFKLFLVVYLLVSAYLNLRFDDSWAERLVNVGSSRMIREALGIPEPEEPKRPTPSERALAAMLRRPGDPAPDES